LKKFSLRFNLNYFKELPVFAGCKGNSFFLSRKLFETFFEFISKPSSQSTYSIFQMNFTVFCGWQRYFLFSLQSKSFFDFFQNLFDPGCFKMSVELCRYCGCKSSTLSRNSKLIPTFFISFFAAFP